jgi:hypothetical protein
MVQDLDMGPTPVEGVGVGTPKLKLMPGVELDTTNHALRINYPVEYKSLLLLVARGLRSLVTHNRGNTTYLKTTKILKAAFYDEYDQVQSVHTPAIIRTQVSYILRKLREAGFIDKVDGVYALPRTSPLWDIAKNSTPSEFAEFLFETIMTLEG